MKQIALMFALVGIAIGGACSSSLDRVSPLAPANSDSLAAKPGSGDIGVTTVFENVDANGFLADFSNDGLGSYVNGVGAVKSILAANAYNGLTNGDWQFDDLSSTTRKVGFSLDQDDAILPGDPAYLVPATPPYWGTQLSNTKMEVKCTFVHHSMLTMAAGTTVQCPLVDRFFFNGWQYGLQPARSFTGWPETTDVQVVCNSADAGGCNDWFIEPIGETQAIARLNKNGVKPNDPSTHIGTFYLRFRIHVTRP